jgi:hypothetical protein
MADLTRASVQEAHQLIKQYIHLTPVLTSTTLSKLASTPQSPSALQGTPHEGCAPAHPRINLFFKCENFQRIGAFKPRGAFHALARLSDEQLARGVATHSSGTPRLDISSPLRAALERSPNTDFYAQATMHKPSPLLHRLEASRPMSSCHPLATPPRSPPRKATAPK